MRVRCYLAGPISKGDLCANINQATDAFIRLAKAGLAPMCPHWSVYCKPARTQSVATWRTTDNPIGKRDAVVCEATVDGCPGMTHEDWLAVDLAWVTVADCMLRLPGESAGADREVRHAIDNGLPVFDTVDEVIKWAFR